MRKFLWVAGYFLLYVIICFSIYSEAKKTGNLQVIHWALIPFTVLYIGGGILLWVILSIVKLVKNK